MCPPPARPLIHHITHGKSLERITSLRVVCCQDVRGYLIDETGPSTLEFYVSTVKT